MESERGWEPVTQDLDRGVKMRTARLKVRNGWLYREALMFEDQHETGTTQIAVALCFVPSTA